MNHNSSAVAEVGDKRIRAYLLQVFGELSYQYGNTEKAETNLTEAFNLYRQLGIMNYILKVEALLKKRMIHLGVLISVPTGVID